VVATSLLRRRCPQAVAERVTCRPATTSPGAASSRRWSVRVEKMKVVVSGDAAAHLPPALSELRALDRDLDRPCCPSPFALVGGVWLMWALGYNVSVAVAVASSLLRRRGPRPRGDADLSRPHAWEAVQRVAASRVASPTPDDLYGAVMEGAVERVRPKMMTVVAIMAGCLPIMWGTRHRLGSDEPHRRADGRRNDLVHSADARRHPCALCAGQAVAAASRRADRASAGQDRPGLCRRAPNDRLGAPRPLASALRPKAQRVRDHRRRAQAHGQGGDHRRQQPAGDRIETRRRPAGCRARCRRTQSRGSASCWRSCGPRFALLCAIPRRSPLTSVTCALFIATSVPVPIAMPTFAFAKAGASLMPSPAIATIRPSR
jgi:hypothetical protein